ncbi:UNVERIFIED_CONTAM: Choline/ethanolaminephosphotransferase 2 [Sesamum angustifolium]|uniref:Choline/ethanolaminephosphotransferase 2 n=1 Tax=Sesamum angustifolium TaxID=2727405 RepID=A0AAW2RKW7_9LAMI
MGYIGAHGAAALHKHKYSGVDNSVLSQNMCCSLFGLAVSIYSLFGCHYSYRINVFGYICIAWIYIFTSTGFTSSKMGAFCPRITALLISILTVILNYVAASTQLQDVMLLDVRLSPWPLGAQQCVEYFLVLVISAVPFYCATWNSAEWWAQQFGKSIPFLNWIPFVKDMTMYKAALFLMIIFAVIPTISCKALVSFRIIFSAIVNLNGSKETVLLGSVHNVYKVVQARKGSMLLALAMLYPFVVLLSGVLVWDYLSPSDLMGNYPHLVIVGIGLAFGFLVGRLILAHLCDEPKGLKTNMCMSLFYLPFAIANALTARLNEGVPLVDEFWILLGFVAYTVVLYLHFATSVVHEITTALGFTASANSSSTEQFVAGNFNFAIMSSYGAYQLKFLAERS